MKKLFWLAGAVAALISGTSSAQMPPTSMVFLSSDGSALTLNSFSPVGPTATTSGSFKDNAGLGGCPKGATYTLPTIQVSGGPGAALSFSAPLCTGVKVAFSGTLNPTGPAAGFVLNASWTVTSQGAGQFVPQGGPGPMPPQH